MRDGAENMDAGGVNPAAMIAPGDAARGAAAWAVMKRGIRSPASLFSTRKTSAENAMEAEEDTTDGIDYLWRALFWCAFLPVLAVNVVFAVMAVIIPFIRFNDEQPTAIIAAAPMWLGFALIAAWLSGFALRGGLRLAGVAADSKAHGAGDAPWIIAAGAFAMTIWLLGFVPSGYEFIRRLGVSFTLMRPMMSFTLFGGLGFILFHIVMAVRAHLRQSGETSVVALVLGAGGFALAWFLAGVVPMIFTLALMIDKFD